jgi:hypothetical protein
LDGGNKQPNVAFDGRDNFLSFESIDQTIVEFIRIDDFLREKSSGIKAINYGNQWLKGVLLWTSRCLKVEATVKDLKDLRCVLDEAFRVLGNVLSEKFVDEFPKLIVCFGALVDGAPEVGKEILVPDKEGVIHVADDILVFVS